MQLLCELLACAIALCIGKMLATRFFWNKNLEGSMNQLETLHRNEKHESANFTNACIRYPIASLWYTHVSGAKHYQICNND